MNQVLIECFHGTGIGDQGRRFADILKRDDDWLEARAFHAALQSLCDTEPDCGVTHAARQHWLGAMGVDTQD